MLIIIIFWKDSDGLAIAGLVGLGLGALGTWIWGKIKEEDQEKEQKKQLNLLKQEIALKNQEIQKERDSKDPANPTQTDSDNLMENPNLYCPISNGFFKNLLYILW